MKAKIMMENIKTKITIENMKAKIKDSIENFEIFAFLYKYGTVLVTIFAIMYFAITLPNFFNIINITNILRAISIVSLMALGITISLTVDGFDLSVGATAGFSAVIAAKFMVVWEYGTVPKIGRASCRERV